MKRFFGMLILVVLCSSCDDGDLILDDLNFDNAKIAKCTSNGILYKLNEKEALLLDLPDFVFPSETKTQSIIIGGKNRVVYRFYNGLVASENICETIPPATPGVSDQWNAEEGSIEITSTPIKKVDETNNSTRITGYNHNVVLRNITFKKSDGKNQKYEELIFGAFGTTIENTLPFAFTKALNQCASTKQVYNYINSESLTLSNIDTNLIKNEITPLNAPRTALIGATNNSIIYKSFSGLLTSAYFCTATIPVLPSVIQEWKAASGISNLEGIIEVSTTTFGANGFKHTIVLKKAKMTRGEDSFLLGDTYIYGELITN
ncbi:MAG: hypothetical protein ACRC6O_00445 [Flavobacterium sp.]